MTTLRIKQFIVIEKSLGDIVTALKSAGYSAYIEFNLVIDTSATLAEVENVFGVKF
jgi:hypothetical protein